MIIVNWNTKQLLKDCLQSIVSVGKNVAMEIIIVDNGSADGSVEMCEEFFPEFHLIKNKTNLGFGYANNQGILASRSELLLLLNSDTLVKPGSIGKMVSRMQIDTSVGVLGCRLINSDGSNQVSCMNFPSLKTVLVERLLLYKLSIKLPKTEIEPPYTLSEIPCDWVLGACMLIRKRALEDVGLFDTNIWMYGEELELCYRIKAAGWKIVFYPDATIVHLGGGSWKSKSYSATLLKMTGLLYLFKKHYSITTFFMVFILSAAGALLRYFLWAVLYLYKKDESFLQEMKANRTLLVRLSEII